MMSGRVTPAGAGGGFVEGGRGGGGGFKDDTLRAWNEIPPAGMIMLAFLPSAGAVPWSG